MWPKLFPAEGRRDGAPTDDDPRHLPIAATAVVAIAPDAKSFARGRGFAAWLGLTPKALYRWQTAVGRTSKMGERSLRRLLIIGASAVLRWAVRRKEQAGQWLEEKHGAISRRGWRKLHLALDADSGEIIAQTLTGQDTGDASQVDPLLHRIDGPIGQFTSGQERRDFVDRLTGSQPISRTRCNLKDVSIAVALLCEREEEDSEAEAVIRIAYLILD